MTIDTNDPASDDVSTEPPVRRSVTVPLPTRRGAIAVAAVVVVLGLIVTVVIESIDIGTRSNSSSLPPLSAQAQGGQSLSVSEADRASAVVAATAYTVAFASYDYRHLSKDFAVTEAHAVDPFLTQYRKETAGIQPDLVKLKSISTGKVLSAAAVSVTPTTAVVDLFLDQTIVNSASSKPHLDPQRVQMSLRRATTASPWQITKVTLP
jgi:hypothetical protein